MGKVNHKNWLHGTVIMYFSYLLAIFMIIIFPYYVGIIIFIMIAIGFIFHIKQDYEIIKGVKNGF